MSVWDVVSDLGLVPPKGEHARMLKEIESLLRGVLEGLDGEACLGIVSSMGVDLRGGAFSQMSSIPGLFDADGCSRRAIPWHFAMATVL